MVTLTLSDIDAIAEATVKKLRQEKDLFEFSRKKVQQSELLQKRALSLLEVSRSGLLGQITKQGLWNRCTNGTYPEDVAWYRDSKGLVFMITEFIKQERKLKGYD